MHTPAPAFTADDFDDMFAELHRLTAVPLAQIMAEAHAAALVGIAATLGREAALACCEIAAKRVAVLPTAAELARAGCAGSA